MRKIHSIQAAAVLSIVMAGGLWAGDVKIIANPGIGVTKISAEEIKSVFLATKTSLGDGSRVEPVLSKQGAAHGAFVKEFVGKTEAALETYYRSLVFTGKGSMPKTLANDAEVVAYVAKTKGAIGYVSAGAGTAGVKTLETN